MDKLKQRELKVQGAYVYELPYYADKRGSFQELFNYDTHGKFTFRQANKSVSNKNVIRGIHRSPYAKLCTCVSGSIWDVVVDLRPESPTYLKWDSVWLMAGENQVLIPANCGHGFYSPTDGAILVYLQGGVYNPSQEMNIRWDDPQFNIQWPLRDEPILSEKDEKASNWIVNEEKITHLQSTLNEAKLLFTPNQLNVIGEMITSYAMDALHDSSVAQETFVNSANMFKEESSR